MFKVMSFFVPLPGVSSSAHPWEATQSQGRECAVGPEQPRSGTRLCHPRRTRDPGHGPDDEGPVATVLEVLGVLTSHLVSTVSAVAGPSKRWTLHPGVSGTTPRNRRRSTSSSTLGADGVGTPRQCPLETPWDTTSVPESCLRCGDRSSDRGL